MKLTNKPFGRFGGHWNEIGFQNRDPATDLRSTGVLSLLQWVQFIESHQKYNPSHIDSQNPFLLGALKMNFHLPLHT